MILCIDIGGTAIKYAVAPKVGETVKLEFVREIPSDAKVVKGLGIQKKVEDILIECMKAYQITGVGISTAGVVNSKTGEILYANDNIPDYIGCNLKSYIENRYKIPCVVENDVNCASIGEYYQGSRQMQNSMVCLTVGTGIGSGIILGGKLWVGNGYAAGEVGYIKVGDVTFEENASAAALAKRVNNRKELVLSGREIFTLAKSGDVICIEEIRRMCEELVRGIVIIQSILNVELVVLGGGVMEQKEYLLPLIEQEIKNNFPEQMKKSTKVTFAKLGNKAGMIGVGILVKKKILGKCEIIY